MKSYISSLLIVGFTATFLSGQEAVPLTEIVEAELTGCGKKMAVVAKEDKQTFRLDRIKKTLHGVWRGRVSGNYEERFMADNGYLTVDYFMLVDIDRNEALCFEKFSKDPSIPNFKANATTWTTVMCGGQYLPPAPAQVHEFHKVEDSLDNARGILEAATGLKVGGDEFIISAAWKALVDQQYFEKTEALALAGGLFKPFEIANVVENGENVFDMKYKTELRGLGQTAAKFKEGEPIHGYEAAQFVGVSTQGGDFLVSSLGNGSEWKKSSNQGGLIDTFFEKVVIGPLAAAEFKISEVFYDQAKNGITVVWPSTEGTKFVVERSTDLKEWTEVGTVTGVKNESNFVDTKVPEDAVKVHYRVRVQP